MVNPLSATKYQFLFLKGTLTDRLKVPFYSLKSLITLRKYENLAPPTVNSAPPTVSSALPTVNAAPPTVNLAPPTVHTGKYLR